MHTASKNRIIVASVFSFFFSLLLYCFWQTSDILPKTYQTSSPDTYQTQRSGVVAPVVETIPPPTTTPTTTRNATTSTTTTSSNTPTTITDPYAHVSPIDTTEASITNYSLATFGTETDSTSTSSMWGQFVWSQFTSTTTRIQESKKQVAVEKKIDQPELEEIANLVTSIKQPKEMFKDMWNVWLNSLLAFLYLIIFFYCTHLFNESRWLVSWDWILNKWFTSVFKFSILEKISQNKILRGLSVILSIIILWIVLSFIDPSFDITSVNSILFAWFIVISVILWAMAKEIIFYTIAKLQHQENVHAKIMPIGYLVSMISVAINRILWFLPSVIFGSVLTVEYKNIDSEEVENWRNYTKAVLTAIITSWILRICSNFVDAKAYILVIGISYGMLNDIFWSLTLSDIFWGKKIFKYNKYLRVITYFIVIFFFFYLMLNPSGDFDQVRNSFDNNAWKMLIMLGLIMWLTILFSIYAKYIHPRFYWKSREI